MNEQCQGQSIKRSDFFFSRRALREAINWGDTQLKIHLARLAELEYLVAHRNKTGGFEYELVYDLADAGEALRFPGLADMDALKCAYDAARSEQNDSRSVPGRDVVGTQSVGSRGEESAAAPVALRVCSDLPGASDETHGARPHGKSTSYPQSLPLAAAGV